MRFALVGAEDAIERIAGWLADEGKVVRRFADAKALASLHPDEEFAWAVCAEAHLSECRSALRDRAAAATRCLVIGDQNIAATGDDSNLVVLTTPLRRRVVLEALLTAA